MCQPRCCLILHRRLPATTLATRSPITNTTRPELQTNKSNLSKSNQIYPNQIKSDWGRIYSNQIKLRRSDLFGYLVIWISRTAVAWSNHSPQSAHLSQPSLHSVYGFTFNIPRRRTSFLLFTSCNNNGNIYRAPISAVVVNDSANLSRFSNGCSSQRASWPIFAF